MALRSKPRGAGPRPKSGKARSSRLAESLWSEASDVEIIKAMVSHGLGVSIIPFAAAAKDVKAGRLAYARLRGRKLYRETGWVYMKSDYVPKTVSEVLRVFDTVKDKYLHAIPRA